jgi:hypothetical protein
MRMHMNTAVQTAAIRLARWLHWARPVAVMRPQMPPQMVRSARISTFSLVQDSSIL